MGTFEWRQGRIRRGQESNWRICLDENQFRSTRPRERLLWLPDNRITDYDDEDDEDNDDEDDEDEGPTRSQERLLWLPHNPISASDKHLVFLFLDLMHSTIKRMKEN